KSLPILLISSFSAPLPPWRLWKAVGQFTPPSNSQQSSPKEPATLADITVADYLGMCRLAVSATAEEVS
ncbi:MAG: hypothetical protein AAF622_16250, partial [Cyanobacteria bacterium P01_C01_bin.147]